MRQHNLWLLIALVGLATLLLIAGLLAAILNELQRRRNGKAR